MCWNKTTLVRMMKICLWFTGPLTVALLVGCDNSSGSGGMGTITTDGRPTTGVAYHSAGLGETPVAVAVYKLPDIDNNGRALTPLMFTSSMAIDADGMGEDGIGGAILDPQYGQDDTALHYTSTGKPLDARYVRYFVLPEGFNGQGSHPAVRLGDVAAVFYDGKLTCAIYGDVGAATDGLGTQLGEGSMALADALGIPNDPANGGAVNGVVYIVFPGSGPGDVLSSDQMNGIGRQLFVAAGGIAD
ncbi:MAG: glycoside hydrolase family 75 protein [Verrucomicrobia bacterium]|nr:glycoside hydrolase family 75 protein [Verrucomicrobiota bacterium]MBU1857756.1 glycoside hydrolase family 75 protein [Verrucomicrobiota bacterium]